MNIGIIGMGRAGMNLATFFASQGHCIYLDDINPNATAIALLDNQMLIHLPTQQMIKQVNWLFICVPDDQISHTLEAIDDYGTVELIAHVSGALSLEVFNRLPVQLKRVSFHPIRPFATQHDPPEKFDSTHFGFEGDTASYHAFCKAFPRAGGRVHHIASDAKIQYHLAAVVASNFIIYLLENAKNGYTKLGIDELTARQLTVSLAQNALDNFAKLGASDGLTGPIARGDMGTIKEHLSVLSAEQQHDYLYHVKQTYLLIKDKLNDDVQAKFELLWAGQKAGN